MKRNIFSKGAGQGDFDNRQVICPSGRLPRFQTRNHARGTNAALSDLIHRHASLTRNAMNKMGIGFSLVMPGLVPGIHVLAVAQQEKTWVAGTSPAMTESESISSGLATA
jgi:hypothetical protein